MDENIPIETQPGHARGKMWWWLSIAGVLGATVAAGMLHFGQNTAKAEIEPAQTVSIPAGRVERTDLGNELVVQGEFRPYTEVELHSKVTGFLKEIKVDAGDQVKAGQRLATLEVPELKDELEHAKATEERAKADYKNAHLAHDRLATVNKEQPNLVAQQDLDAAEAKENIAAAAMSEAKADAEKFQTLLDYTDITAPFDGVITRRYADPGALIQTGGSSAPLVRISNNYKLRLDFPVSVSFVKNINVGDAVEVQVDGMKKSFSSKIARFTRKVETDTRTMEAEVEVANADLELIPGMYATVKLQVERRPKTLAVSVEAISGGKNPTVLVINKNNEIEERKVTLGIETPTEVEILSGLQENEAVVVGSRTQIKPGQKVEPKFAALATAK